MRKAHRDERPGEADGDDRHQDPFLDHRGIDLRLEHLGDSTLETLIASLRDRSGQTDEDQLFSRQKSLMQKREKGETDSPANRSADLCDLRTTFCPLSRFCMRSWTEKIPG